MHSRSSVAPFLLLAVVSCGDDGGSSGGGGPGGGTSSSSAATTTASTASSSSVASSSTTGGDGGATTGDGGGGAGQGGLGGAGGIGGDGGAGGIATCRSEPDPLPILAEPPELLSETGLYASLPDLELGPGIMAYDVRFALWSDGADKARWVYLPGCTTVDTTDMDHWVFPVGTRLYKEFALGGITLETRVIHRYGPGEDDWWYATYAWNADDSEATRVDEGVIDARGTTHDIPSEQACRSCHTHLPERILGFSAVQLAHEDLPLTLNDLDAAGWLTTEAPVVAIAEDDPVALAALGVLHANCGHCHNQTSDGIFFIEPFDMRLRVSDVDVLDTQTSLTAVDVETSSFGGTQYRIASGDTADSCVSVRMATRGNVQQMPPLGTEYVDVDGLASIDAWIVALGQ